MADRRANRSLHRGSLWGPGRGLACHGSQFAAKTKGEKLFTSPRVMKHAENLLLLVEFHTISDVDIFQSENDHSSGGCVGGANDHNFAYGTTGKIGDADYLTFAMAHELGLDRGRILLRVFCGGSLERE